MRVSVVATLLALIATAAARQAQAQISREEALAGVYGGAAIRAERVFLTETQQNDVRRRSGSDVPSALIARYIAMRDGDIVGRAYVDTHVVRTKNESLLISLDGHGRVKRVDVTAFLEPGEYRAGEPWLRQYRDKALTDEMAVNRAIRPIAGATLTARAVTAAVRRVLAIDEVLSQGAAATAGASATTGATTLGRGTR